MGATVQHVLTATTPDDPAAEVQMKHWNSVHVVAVALISAAEISGAFSNANGISFGDSAGKLTASYTVPAQSVQTQASGNIAGAGFTSTSTVGVDVKATQNSAGLSLAVPAYITTFAAQTVQTQASGAIPRSGFTTTTVAGSVVAGTHDTDGLKLAVPAYLTTAQAPGAYLTTARASNDAVGLNTAQTNVTWTVNSSGLSINAGGYAGTGFTSTSTAGTDIKATNNTAGLSMAVPAYLTTAQAPGAYLTTARASSDAIGLNSGGSNVTWTVNSSGLTFDGRGYAGTGTSATNASVTLNSNGLAISVAAPGAAANNSYYPFLGNNYIQGTTAITSLGKSTVLVQPLFLPQPQSFSYVRIPASINFGNTGSGTTAARSWTIRQTDTYWVNFYSLGTGGSSRSLQYVTGSSTAVTASVVYSIGAASNNQTLVHAVTLPSEGGALTYNTTINPNSASFTFHTSHLVNSLVGNKWIDVNCAVSLSAGAWWVGIARSSASASTSAGGDFAQMTLVTSQGSLYGVSQINIPVQPWGADTSASTGAAWQMGLGAWTTNTNGSTSSSMALSHIVSVVNQPMFPLLGVRQV